MRTIIKIAFAAASVAAFLAATGPVAALPLRQPPQVTRADAVPAQVRHHHRRGRVYFNFGLGFDSPFIAPYYAYPYYQPYYVPRYYQPYYVPRYYRPAPYAYEPEPYRSDSTGRCSAGQQFRYPVGCVPN